MSRFNITLIKHKNHLPRPEDCQDLLPGGGQGGGAGGAEGAESLKAAATAATGGGTFWTSGEHFGPTFTLFCRICSFVANHACLTVF